MNRWSFFFTSPLIAAIIGYLLGMMVHFLLTISFVALPVIPALKLMDTGLFECNSFLTYL